MNISAPDWSTRCKKCCRITLDIVMFYCIQLESVVTIYLIITSIIQLASNLILHRKNIIDKRSFCSPNYIINFSTALRFYFYMLIQLYFPICINIFFFSTPSVIITILFRYLQFGNGTNNRT